MMLTRLTILLTSSLTSLTADLDTRPPPPLMVFRQVVSLASDPSVSPAIAASDLEAVLADKVSSARCHAHCSAQLACPGSPECGRCVRVCDLLREGPAWTNLCEAPGLCREGCQVACGAAASEDGDDDGDHDNVRSARHHDPEEEDLGLRLEQCSLQWAGEGGSVYLVASEDRSGMFYHLGTVTHRWINLTPDILDKAERLIVLVIGEEGVTQRSQIEVTQNICHHLEL